MKIAIEIEGRFDGPAVDDDALTEAIMNELPSVILSEGIDGTDDWVFLMDSISASVKTKNTKAPTK